jgi:hypothetical protein
LSAACSYREPTASRSDDRRVKDVQRSIDYLETGMSTVRGSATTAWPRAATMSSPRRSSRG